MDDYEVEEHKKQLNVANCKKTADKRKWKKM